MKTRIVNKRHGIPFGSVYIGRPSVFGNPFIIGPDGDRDTVCDKYEVYARERIETDPFFRRAVQSLCGKTLICWCAPLRCHGETLARLAEELRKCK